MTELRDQLRDLVEPGRGIEWTWDDPVFGTQRCQVAGCVRGAGGDGSKLCEEHGSRWKAGGRPAIDRWDGGPPVGPTVLMLNNLPEQVQLELRYGVQRARQRRIKLGPTVRQMRLLVHQLDAAGVASLLQHDEWAWPQPGGKPPGQMRNKLILFTIDELDAMLGIAGREHELARDCWRLRRLGLDDSSGIRVLRFDTVVQPWLRDAIRKFMLWRLEFGRATTALNPDLDALTGLASRFTLIAGQHAAPAQLTTEIVEMFLASLTGARSNRLVATARSSVTSFLSYVHKHDLVPGLAARAVAPETPVRPRGLSGGVMAQLGSAHNLDRLPDHGWRLLFQLILHAGLQIDDALSVEIDCVFRNSAGVPNLRYFNREQACLALIEISHELYQAVAARRDEMLTQSDEAGWLLFRDIASPGDTVIVTSVLRNWLRHCELRDDEGYPMEVTVAQFRYAVRVDAKRVIESTDADDGPAVDVTGRTLEWCSPVRGATELLNGYCRLPLDRSCPHPNACLTCPNFVTTRHFLSMHREQLTQAERMIKRGQHRGEMRLVEANQRIAANLATIIAALHAR